MAKIIQSARILDFRNGSRSFRICFNDAPGANHRRVDALAHRILADLLDVAAGHFERAEPMYLEDGAIVVECDDLGGRAFWIGQAIETLENNGIPGAEE